jgi:hypothetical protein
MNRAWMEVKTRQFGAYYAVVEQDQLFHSEYERQILGQGFRNESDGMHMRSLDELKEVLSEHADITKLVATYDGAINDHKAFTTKVVDDWFNTGFEQYRAKRKTSTPLEAFLAVKDRSLEFIGCLESGITLQQTSFYGYVKNRCESQKPVIFPSPTSPRFEYHRAA